MAARSRSLAGKVVAITGGGRGIGAATAAVLVQAGARVALGDLDVETAKRTADRLGEAAVALPLDVTDRTGFTAFLDEVESQLGPLDVLINNAGIMPIGPIEDESDRITTSQLAINLHAVIHGSREAIRRMKPRGRGHIVNVASAAGKIPVPGGATYAATKFGVVGFCESIRGELRGTGIEVSCVMPGIVNTELAAGLEENPVFKTVSPDDVAQAIARAIAKPRFEVFVPRSIGPSVRMGAVMGRRFGEWLQRTLKTDKLMLDAAGSAARSAYEARAATSAPTADQEAERGTEV